METSLKEVHNREIKLYLVKRNYFFQFKLHYKTTSIIETTIDFKRSPRKTSKEIRIFVKK